VQGLCAAEASFESWSRHCLKVEKMLCPAGFVISSSFFELFHAVQSHAIYSAFLELSQLQCEALTKSLCTEMKDLFQFISKDQNGRVLKSNIFPQILALLQQHGEIIQWHAESKCFHYVCLSFI
jgi:hypothetical protein